MMRYVPYVFLGCVGRVFGWYYFGVAFVDHFIHELNVVFSILLVDRKSFL